MVTLGMSLPADRRRAWASPAGLDGFAGMLECRDGWRVAAGCAWSGGGELPAPVVQELGDVVHGAQQLDLGVDGVAAAVVDVAAEPGEQLGEGGLDEGGAALVQLL